MGRFQNSTRYVVLKCHRHWTKGRFLQKVAFKMCEKMCKIFIFSWSNGDSFEGYCKNGQPHGHGVYRSVSTNFGQQFYVGAFENGVKHGYGVMSTNSE